MKSIGIAQLSKRTKYDVLPGQKWPGFSFALHPLRVQGFYFALLQYSPIQAFTAAFILSMQLYSQRRKTAHRALQWRFMRLFPPIRQRYQTDTIDYNATCATLERITASRHLRRVPDTRRYAGRCTGQHSRPIIIRYKGAAYRRTSSPAGCSVSTCTGSARHPPSGGAL